MTLKGKDQLSEVTSLEESGITNLSRYRCRSLPAAALSSRRRTAADAASVNRQAYGKLWKRRIAYADQ